MSVGPQLLLISAVAAVGVLHTIVPDHWVPITLIARQQGWSRAETARASFQAGVGHVASTLVIAVIVWLSGVELAERFGHIVDTVASVALVSFGLWIAISSWRDLHSHGGHGHGHDFAHLPGQGQGTRESSVHGPELQRIDTPEGVLELSIFESGVPPRFRLTGVSADRVLTQVRWDDGRRQDFLFASRGSYWESIDEIPEPHQFAVSVIVHHDTQAHRYETRFIEHQHGHPGHTHHHSPDHDRHGHNHHGHEHDTPPGHDPLYAPLRGQTAMLTRHIHSHRHSGGSVHAHWHDHLPASSHAVTAEIAISPPEHDHRHKTTARTALLLILGSSPMVEGIPAFFAAGKYGVGLIAVMALVFALSTIATYVLLCVYSTVGLQRARFGAVERYGEVLSGAFIALVGLAFWIWPVL